MAARRPVAILTDIEGTTTPIAFVHDVLFPYTRARLPALLERPDPSPALQAALADAARLAGDRPVLDALLAWMDADAKVTPLKTLQGLIWDEGFRAGTLHSRLYPDVPPVLRRWHASGLHLHVYSSGSEAAQRLVFAHAEAGDLTGLFGGFFDTRIGPKVAPDSYTAIAGRIGVAPDGMLFLSDIERELDAAAEAGLATCQLVRAADATVASARHRNAADFDAVDAMLA